MLPSVLPRLSTDSAVRMFPSVWKPLFLRLPSRDGAPSLPLLSLFFCLLCFFLPLFEDNGLLFWVPDVLCRHSEVVLWNLLGVKMFFWWICGGESVLPVLFLRHLSSSPYWAHLCLKCSLGFSNYLKEISSLSNSVVFLYFFALVAEEAFLISPCYSLELCIQMGISFLFFFAFHLPSFHSYL